MNKYNSNLLLKLFLLATTATLVVKAQDEDVVVDEYSVYPDTRYSPWASVDAVVQQGAAEQLGYNETTWNNPGMNEIETVSFYNLTVDQRLAAASMLQPAPVELVEDTWDCYINHYGGYDWPELKEYEIQQYYLTLGWTEDSWNGVIDPPVSDNTLFADLSEEEREAADKLCFFNYTWDPPLVPNPIPEWDWIAVTEAPVSTTTTPIEAGQPTSAPETSIPTALPSLSPTTDTSVPPPYPNFRYKPWELLDDDIQELVATKLDYNETTWNNPGTAILEWSNSWEGLTTDQREALTQLGFAPRSWNCFVNHYEAFTWSELRGYGVQRYVGELGWDELSWAGLALPPATDNITWANLTSAEQQAAELLCLSNYTWDEIPITEWEEWLSAVTPVSATPAPAAGATPSAAMIMNELALRSKFLMASVGLTLSLML